MRDNKFDNIKGILIILVILGHVALCDNISKVLIKISNKTTIIGARK